MNPSEFIHPEDAAAMKQMQAIPGFSLVIKKFLAIGYETMQYGENMASSIRLSEKQLPEIYRHLPPICQRLGIEEPEFYLQMNPVPNAWTFGDTRIYITVTSGLVEMMNGEELDAVLAHECGHILCHHVLYHNMANILLRQGSSILGFLSAPLQYALLYWYRKSELTCDRAAAIITSPEVVASTMARLAGGPKSLTSKVNMEEWAKQADEYDKIYNDGAWNKTLQVLVTAGLDHPFSAVRVREILKWSQTDQYRSLKSHALIADRLHSRCPGCGSPVDPSWKFCKTCGYKLK